MLLYKYIHIQYGLFNKLEHSYEQKLKKNKKNLFAIDQY